MHPVNKKSLWFGCYGGFIRHSILPPHIRSAFFIMALAFTCAACQVSAGEPEAKETTDQKSVIIVSNSTLAGMSSTGSSANEEALTTSNNANEKVALESMSGTFRMAMSFDKGVKVKVRNEVEGGATSQPDGSQVSLLEISSRNGKIESCIQTSLERRKMVEQPICTIDGDAIKLVFSDGKAAFNATMEAVVRPDGTGAYKGPLLIRAAIIPDGQPIGELSLTRP